MKKRNGYTLVELLVTIAIILSILIISIVSVNGVSKKRKEDAYEDVKKQIENAANDYFYDNEYLFEGLSDGSSGRISLGKLVSEDYINAVTNPITGKKLGSCTYAEITKNGKKYEIKYIDEEFKDKEKCDTDNSIEMREKGAPKINVIISGGNKNGWYNDKNTKAVATITNIDGVIKNVKVTLNGKEVTPNKSGDSYTVMLESDVKNGMIRFEATNSYGKTASSENVYKKDATPPSCTVSVSGKNNGQKYVKKGWYTGNVTITKNCKDEGSGCPKSSTQLPSITNEQKLTKVDTGKIYDNAGNAGNCGGVTFGIDKTKPICTVSVSGKNNGQKYVKKGWYTDTVTITKRCEDKGSDCQEKSIQLDPITNEQKLKNVKIGKIYDNAGNSEDCGTKKIGIERSVSLTFRRGDTNNTQALSTKFKKPVFANEENVCKYGTCSNIKACDGGNNKDSKTTVSKNYFARACMDVTDYLRYFTAKSNAIGEVDVCSFGNEKYNNKYKSKKGYSCINDSIERNEKRQRNMENKNFWENYYNIAWNDIEENQKVTTSKDTFTYTSPAGNKASVTLYTEYIGECGY